MRLPRYWNCPSCWLIYTAPIMVPLSASQLTYMPPYKDRYPRLLCMHGPAGCRRLKILNSGSVGEAGLLLLGRHVCHFSPDGLHDVGMDVCSLGRPTLCHKGQAMPLLAASVNSAHKQGDCQCYQRLCQHAVQALTPASEDCTPHHAYQRMQYYSTTQLGCCSKQSRAVTEPEKNCRPAVGWMEDMSSSPCGQSLATACEDFHC